MFTVGTRVAMVIESAIAKTTFRYEGTVTKVASDNCNNYVAVLWDKDKDSTWYGENSRAFRTIQPA